MILVSRKAKTVTGGSRNCFYQAGARILDLGAVETNVGFGVEVYIGLTGPSRTSCESRKYGLHL